MLLRDTSSRSSDDRGPSEDDARTRYQTLSSRERSVLLHVAEGYSVGEIARMLNITTRTVSSCKARIAQKLGFTHRVDYMGFAVQLGLTGSASSQQGATTTGARSSAR